MTRPTALRALALLTVVLVPLSLPAAGFCLVSLLAVLMDGERR